MLVRHEKPRRDGGTRWHLYVKLHQRLQLRGKEESNVTNLHASKLCSERLAPHHLFHVIYVALLHLLQLGGVASLRHPGVMVTPE